MRWIVVIAMLLGCSRAKPDSTPSAPRHDELQAQYNTRLGLFTAADGWPSKTDCDGTVWAGVACLGGAAVKIDLAEYPAGVLNRRPSLTCWVPGAPDPQPSASTASNDTATLYASCAFKQKDRGALERLLAYADANEGYIGLPHQLDLTKLEEGLRVTMERAIQDLGGTAAPKHPVVELPPGKDYQIHIVTEQVDFAAKASGGVSGWELGIMEILAKAAAPSDALVQAELGVYTGDFTKAENLLLDTNTPCPSYVRGDQPKLFCDAWWLRAAAIVMEHTK